MTHAPKTFRSTFSALADHFTNSGERRSMSRAALIERVVASVIVRAAAGAVLLLGALAGFWVFAGQDTLGGPVAQQGAIDAFRYSIIGATTAMLVTCLVLETARTAYDKQSAKA